MSDRSISKEEIEELKAYVEGVKHGYIIMEQMGHCKYCGKYEDLRLGVCFDCAMPKCPFATCEYKRLVWTGPAGDSTCKQVWKNCQYKDRGKTYCDRDSGLCDKAKKHYRLRGK